MTGVTAEIAADRERRQEAKAKARREHSVRLGPESLGLAPFDNGDLETIAPAAVVLGEERS
jgi:hypothetical protein